MLERASPPARQRTSAILPVVAEGVHVARGGRVLLDIDRFELAGAGATAVIGPNGAGKSLLFRVLAGLLQPDRGTVTWCGDAPARAAYRNIGVMMQHPVLLRRSARANIAFALRAVGCRRRERAQMAAAVIGRAGLRELENSSARSLSGGERQRLALARALVTRPDLLLLDEPTASTDPPSTLAIENMVAQACAEGIRVLLITQDIAQARRLADEVVFMNRGRVEERRPAADFFEHPGTQAARAFLAGEILATENGGMPK